jgi:acetyltransferase-like isoleucine patch superfamily enzyme
MQKIIVLFFKALRLIKVKFLIPIDWLISYFIFYVNGVEFSSFSNHGWPRVNVGRGGKCVLGKGFKSNNREMSNPIGRFNRCSLIVGNKGTLIIGKNVGMSSVAIVCHHHIEIGDNVNLGGNVVIYDTDFHSLDAESRLDSKTDKAGTITAAIKIGNSVFIGGHATILKGVEIGENSIVGACSVITKNIPANEIWAGNPAKLVRTINNTENSID